MMWLFAILPVLTAALAIINRWTWPRGRSGVELPDAPVSFLVPMRDEADHARGCLQYILQVARPQDEVLVFDDGSSDATPQIVSDIAERDPRVRLLERSELPNKWVGKSYACHQLGRAARGSWLVFVDADVRLRPEALSHIEDLSVRYEADVVSFTPRQRMLSWAEDLIVPWLHLSYVCWLPLGLIPRTKDPRVLAANGQVLAVKRRAYDLIGGHKTVATAVVEDMAFCRAAKAQGLTVVFGDGHGTADCRMYRDWNDGVRGFAKNLCLGVGGPLALALVAGLYFLAFLVPWLLAAATYIAPSLAPVAAVGIAANLIVRVLAVTGHGHSWSTTWTHPLAVFVFLYVAARSWWWTVKGTVYWRNRSYAVATTQEKIA